MMEKFPIGAVVYLFTDKETLMTVNGHTDEGVVVIWFDDKKELHGETVAAGALKVRIANPGD